MKRPQLIQLAGPAQVGKSTTANALVNLLEKHGKQACTVSYAGHLYRVVSLLTSIPEEWLRAHKATPITKDETGNPVFWGRTPRQILQIVGEGMRQSFGTDIWLGGIISLLEYKGVGGLDFIIVDDARHVPEFKLGRVVELQRTGIDYTCDHPSAMPPPEDYVWRRVSIDGSNPQEVAHMIELLMWRDGLLETNHRG